LPLTPLPSVAPPLARRRVLVAVVAALALGGCAGVRPAADDGAARTVPANAEPPAPAVNLSGFPLPYRQGYADGCASAGGGERKDTLRFGAVGNYRTGWQDGLALGRRK